jgi:hypothetical protein
MSFRDNFPPPGGRTIRLVVRPATEADADAFIAQLLNADWNAPDSPIRLADDLSFDDVRHVLFFDQARQFLQLVDENKGAPLTATGNLNRAYVGQMIEKMDWLRRYMEPLKRGGLCKVFDQMDVEPLDVLHGVCEYGKLIHKRRNRAFVTTRGRELCDDAQAGRLYRLLFLTLFRNFDLDYISGYRETPLVQDTLAVILWRLQMVARDWIAADRLPPEVFLTRVLEQARAVSTMSDMETTILRHEVLEPLVWFGLLESDQIEDEWYRLRAQPKFRKTPLFDRFLTFIWTPGL